MKIEDGFSLVPNNIITDDDSILKQYGDKGFLIMLYIIRHRTVYNKAYITIENCIEECGYKPSRTKGKTNDQFKEVVLKMIDDGVIKAKINKEKIGISDLIICNLEQEYDNFFKLEGYQYDWIMNSKSKCRKINLLKLFCAIKVRMQTRHKSENIYDGLYEVAFPSYMRIKMDTGISESNIKKYIDELVELNLIRYDNAGRMINSITGEEKECNNTYTIYKEGWEDEIQGSIRLFKKKKKEEGWIFIKKENNNKKSIGGRIGYLKKCINNGTASEEMIDEYNKVKNKL
ncbi:hypothetical protein ACSW9O_16210 (plasmid) [Clostridium perfringens]